MTNELEIMLKEAVVDKSDALSWHFPSGPQTTKSVGQPDLDQDLNPKPLRVKQDKNISKHYVASSI